MIVEAFKPLKSFIVSIKEDRIMRPQMYKYVKYLSITWKEQSANELSQELRKLFKLDFNKIADGLLSLLSYIFSHGGFKWFKANQN